jgi:hypothetical protein
MEELIKEKWRYWINRDYKWREDDIKWNERKNCKGGKWGWVYYK